nr:AgmX/PglI C-terminal domain-containing protein [Kofleriaceae bacterium]
GSELGQELNDVKESGKTVSTGGGTGRGSRGNGDPRTGTGKGTGVGGPTGTTTVDGGKVAEKTPGGRINVSDKQALDESSLTPDLVLAKIQSAYMAGLKRCYKTYLVKDATARGKVTLSFTVNESGRATGGRAKGFAGEVDDCIAGQMGSWRFAVPVDKDNEPTTAAFAISLQLVPE